jgi:hypothetical protein
VNTPEGGGLRLDPAGCLIVTPEDMMELLLPVCCYVGVATV